MNPLLALYGSVWAILPSYFRAMSHAMATRQSELDRVAEIAAATDRRRAEGKPQSTIGVIPIVGPIENRPSMMGEMCGFASDMVIADTVEEMVRDNTIKAIVLDFDSPGGVATGTPEAASRIMKARGTKPIVAVANGMAASKGYWLATAADKVYVTPSGEVGSVGVFSIHQDVSAAMEMEGVKTTIIKAGKYKAEMNPYEPLTDESKDYEQSQVDEIYSAFVDSVASQRGVASAVVRSDFGEGRVVSAKKAVSAGMADGVATIQQVMSRLQSGKLSMSTLKNQQASEDWDSEPADVMLDRLTGTESRRRRLAMKGR